MHYLRNKLTFLTNIKNTLLADNPLISMCDHYGLKYINHPEMKESNAAVVDISDDLERKSWTQEVSEWIEICIL